MKSCFLLVIVGCIIFDAEAAEQCKADFVDSEGDDCKKYVDKKWCKPNGDYGENWKLNAWGPFSKYAVDGYDATACPGCGCGGAATCEEGQCWCVSNGGRTCLDSITYNVIECTKDECWDKSGCNKRGHWCDDSLLSTSEDFELVDCSEYYFLDDHANVYSASVYQDHDYAYVGLKTYVNCVQAQMVKMQKMMKKMQSLN